MNVMRRKLFELSKIVLGCVVVTLCSVALVSSAMAEQIKILDSSGNTRSMLELSSGASATIKVLLAGNADKTPQGVSVSLLNASTNRQEQAAISNSRGVAEFLSVSGGTYSVTVTDPQISVADVQVVKPAGTGQQTRSEDRTREESRAMYVAGASAVAGVAGLAAVLDSDSGSSGGGESAVGFVTSSEAVRAGNVAGQPKPIPRDVPKPKPIVAQDFTGIQPPPDSNPVSPAPTIAPDDVNDPPTGDPVENPDEPDDNNVAPPPDFTDPMTPS